MCACVWTLSYAVFVTHSTLSTTAAAAVRLPFYQDRLYKTRPDTLVQRAVVVSFFLFELLFLRKCKCFSDFNAFEMSKLFSTLCCPRPPSQLNSWLDFKSYSENQLPTNIVLNKKYLWDQLRRLSGCPSWNQSLKTDLKFNASHLTTITQPLLLWTPLFRCYSHLTHFSVTQTHISLIHK